MNPPHQGQKPHINLDACFHNSSSSKLNVRNIFSRIASVPQNIIMDLNNVMSMRINQQPTQSGYDFFFYYFPLHSFQQLCPTTLLMKSIPIPKSLNHSSNILGYPFPPCKREVVLKVYYNPHTPKIHRSSLAGGPLLVAPTMFNMWPYSIPRFQPGKCSFPIPFLWLRWERRPRPFLLLTFLSS